MEQFNFRIGNIELRTTSLGTSVLEIVQWNESMCWQIVSFYKSRDTAKWNAVFDEDRPLDSHVNWNHLRQLIKAGYEFLSGKYEFLSEAE